MCNINDIRDFILKKTLKNGSRFGDLFPSSSHNGKYRHGTDIGWTGSFWPGLNYLCYEMSGNEFYLDTARKTRLRFADKLYKETATLHHDTGFLYTLSCVADYKLTGNPDAKKLALDAAVILTNRFNKNGNYIQAWPMWEGSFGKENRGRIIIDCMYNLPLLFWAWKETGNDMFFEAASSHADTASKTLVRKDYSTFHTFLLDPDTGDAKYGATFQGYSDESCWSRGQAWAIGGFAHAYGYTGNKKYLDISRKCALFFLENLDEDLIPMWDFRLPQKNGEPRDTSAAAIAASGILEINKYLSGAEKQYFMNAAHNMIKNLYDQYSTKDMEEEEGLILHGCGFRTENIDIDNPLIYGDYYFVEAVARLLGKDDMYW